MTGPGQADWQEVLSPHSSLGAEHLPKEEVALELDFELLKPVVGGLGSALGQQQQEGLQFLG